MVDEKVSILLAEDDPNLGLLLADLLEIEGYHVKLCKDGQLALAEFAAQSYDLCLLDIMLPKLDGFSVAKEIRKENKAVPIIFITARSMKADKLAGYDVGADDYITKPFDEEELLWKVKAIIRRVPGKATDEIKPIRLGTYEFDVRNHCLRLNGSVKRMTEKECEVLQFLSRNQNRVIRREELLKAVWGENDYFLGRSLDVFITKIRKYLKEDGSLRIENVFGVGFIFHTGESPNA